MSTEMHANMGVVGLAVMGSNLARNLASREGNAVAVYNRSPERTDLLMQEHRDAGFVASKSIEEFAASLSKPRTAIIMVQAGTGTDAVIDQLAELFERGRHHRRRRQRQLSPTRSAARRRVTRDGHATSSAPASPAARRAPCNGPSIMPGGSDEAYETLGPILASIAAVAEGEPCVTHVGPDGAGHFVKMIHNGIEYADMQLIAEAYDLIRRGAGSSRRRDRRRLRRVEQGRARVYLIEITAEVLRQADAETGKPLVDVILDQAGPKGTGQLDRADRLELGVPVVGHRRGRRSPRALVRRSPSSAPPPATAARPRRASSRRRRRDFIDDVREALYASKIVAYAQGFDAIVAGAAEYDWDIDIGAIAKIWRGGCIIRAQFLNRIAEAYRTRPRARDLARRRLLRRRRRRR